VQIYPLLAQTGQHPLQLSTTLSTYLSKRVLEAANMTGYIELKSIRPRDLFYAISSVPCFEYWVLLHFEYTTQAFVRTGKQTPCESVITRVKKHLPEYSKGTGKLYDIIGDNTDVAIKRAEQANRDGARAGTDNPSTDVGSLIQYLRKIKA